MPAARRQTVYGALRKVAPSPRPASLLSAQPRLLPTQPPPRPRPPAPSDAVLAAWAGVTGAGLDALTDLARRAKSGTPDWFMPYRQAEAEASILRCCSPVLVPGLLPGRVLVRDTRDRAGAVLWFSPQAWRRFTGQVKAGA